MTPPRLAAAIVAGGRARRFGGRDKSRLVIEGRPIIVRQMEVLGRVTDQIFVVANEAAPFADLGLPVYPDVVKGAGALGGVHAALHVSSTERVLVVACDLPFLDARVLERLVALTDEADGAWIRTARGVEPLLACYRRAAADTIRQVIDAGHLKASALDHVLRMAVLDENELVQFGSVERLLANVNTPEDYARLV